MTIWQRLVQGLRWQSKAFTLLDSLLALVVSSFVIVGLALSITQIFSRVEESLFFADFEQVYLETQRLSATQGQVSQLEVSSLGVRSPYRQLDLPATVRFEGQRTIVFDTSGGNSSLAKLIFHTEAKEITYQLYLGSGKYQKTEHQRIHTP